MEAMAKCPDDCIHKHLVGGIPVICGYLLDTGKMRGCDPGMDCIRYVPKKSGTRRGPKTPKWDLEKGREMWQAGCKDKEIAAALGAKVESVRNYRRCHWQKGV